MDTSQAYLSCIPSQFAASILSKSHDPITNNTHSKVAIFFIHSHDKMAQDEPLLMLGCNKKRYKECACIIWCPETPGVFIAEKKTMKSSSKSGSSSSVALSPTAWSSLSPLTLSSVKVKNRTVIFQPLDSLQAMNNIHFVVFGLQSIY